MFRGFVAESGDPVMQELRGTAKQHPRGDGAHRGVWCADPTGEPVTGEVEFNDPHRAPPFYVIHHRNDGILA